MVDWLVVWGVTQAVGFVFAPILKDLAQDAAKDFTKDFFKDCLKKVLIEYKEPLDKAAGKAITEFLKLFQDKLEDAELETQEIKTYLKPLKQLLKVPAVQETLGKPFLEDIKVLDTKTLAETWKTIADAPTLPDEFSWEKIGKRYLKRVKDILAESKELRTILDLRIQEDIARSAANIAGIPPEFELEKYQESILDQYGNLKLDNLDVDACAYNRLRLWQIFVQQNVRECQEYLPKVYEIPKEYLRKLRESQQVEAEFSEEELERYQRIYQNQSIRSVLEVVSDPILKYLVILGDPGSGKSTLLQYIALEWAELPSSQVSDKPIPLLIELRKYIRNFEAKQCKNFLEFIHQGSAWVGHLNQQILHEWLKKGQAVVMFDGLDEIFESALREETKTQIHNFTQTYPNVRVIVTSRVVGYTHQQLRDADFHHFMLQDLETEQIEEFIQKWHDLTYQNEDEKIRKRDRLKKAISESSAIQELAGNPLLLTMMAILNRNQDLPRDRVTLYEQASRVLLHQWDIERQLEDHRLDAKTIDVKDKQAMLRPIAYFMQTNTQGRSGNVIYVEDLERLLREYLKTIEISNPRVVSRLLIEQLRLRNFILCHLGAEYYAFVHRTFLEYFCAMEIVEKFEKKRDIDLETLKTEIFGKYWPDEKWHEILLLISGTITVKFVGEIIEYLMQQDGEEQKFTNLFLAARCLNEVRNRAVIVAIDTQLLERIKQLTQYDLNYYYRFYDLEATLVEGIRTKAVAAIAMTWHDDPSTLPWLKQLATSDDNSAVRRAAVWELAQGWHEHPDTLPWLKQRATTDDDSNMRHAAVQELAQGWKDDPDTLPILKRATTDDDSDVRQAAVQELARGWKDDPHTLPWLKQLATTDDDWAVRYAAVQELARGWKDHPDTLPILKRASTDDNWPVRWAAVQELAQGWKDHPDTLPWLKQLATTDDNSDVRRVAVQELARGWKDHPDTLPILKRATTDDNWYVRRVAVQELARGWKDHPDTLPWLKQLATSDHDSHVRSAAVQELACGWKDHPDTLPILKRAPSDHDSDVRWAAVQQLARGWKDHPDTLPWLKQLATSDDYWYVRWAAVQELARGWKDHPELFGILHNMAMNDPFVREEDWQENPRRVALEIISKQYRTHPQTIPLLRHCLEQDADKKVREFAEEALRRFQ
jgi:predicted NACHT family NTPase